MFGFAQVPAELLEAPVSSLAKVLWVVLDRHQRNNGNAWPSRAHLAEHLACSPRHVGRAVTELVETPRPGQQRGGENCGWLAIETGGGRGNTNRYVLLGRPEVIHNGDTGAHFRHGKGAPAPTSGRKRGAGVLRKGAPAPTEERTSERQDSGTSSAQPQTARAKHRRPRCIAPDCTDGWLGLDDQERPIPCPSCRPHTAKT